MKVVARIRPRVRLERVGDPLSATCRWYLRLNSEFPVCPSYASSVRPRVRLVNLSRRLVTSVTFPSSTLSLRVKLRTKARGSCVIANEALKVTLRVRCSDVVGVVGGQCRHVAGLYDAGEYG